MKVCLKQTTGGVCTYTLSKGRYPMTQEEFRAMSLGMVYMEPASWGAMRKVIEELCAKSKQCEQEEVQDFLDFFAEEWQASEY